MKCISFLPHIKKTGAPVNYGGALMGKMFILETNLNHMLHKKLTAFLLLLCISVAAYAQADLKKLDAYYEKALKDWGVPGMAIAIVKDGKVIFAKGYGVKEAGKTEKVDENTLFAIASNTKAFTATAIGQLVDDGTLKWNDKVRKYVPYFELYDPWVSAETNIRDILSHRVGLGTFSGDIIWYRSNLSAEQIIRRAKYLPKSFDFRSGYGYSNVMFVTAGEVMKKAAGKEWGEVVSEKIFRPLGMDRTIYTPKDLGKKGNYASPHLIENDIHKPMAWEDWGTIAAMGGIISSVKDMSQWMIFNLNNGIWNGDTLLSPQSRNLLWTPHSTFVVDQTSTKSTGHFNGYGLGWNLSDFKGKLRVSHTGGYSGMLSAVTLVPDEKLGVVVLTNGLKGIYGALVNYTVESFLGGPTRDWSAERLEASRKNVDTRIAERQKARIAGTKPTLAQSKYAGEYFTDTYGKINVSESSGTLRIDFEHTPDLSARLSHWHNDVFEIKWEHPDVLPWFSFGTVKFELDNNGNITGISFDVPNDDLWFEELNAKKRK
jgi:CubicO group peptidase (beta-lactamase class C family)